MPILGPRHDFAHPVESDTAWSESYYFNAYDPASDSGFFTRIGIRPNEGTMDVGLSAWLPGGELAEYRHVVDQHEMVGPPLEVGGVRYELIDALQDAGASWLMSTQWRDLPSRGRRCPPGPFGRQRAVRCRLPRRWALTDRGVRAPRSDQTIAAAGTTGKGHLEQAGRWTGSMTIDDVTHSWDGAHGNRDRSWGPRRWGGPPMWRWFSINIGESMHFGGIRLGTAAGDLHRGWVSVDGEVTSIKEWQLRTELGDDELTQRVVHAVAVDKRDRVLPADRRGAAGGGHREVGRHGGQRGADPVDLPHRQRHGGDRVRHR